MKSSTKTWIVVVSGTLYSYGCQCQNEKKTPNTSATSSAASTSETQSAALNSDLGTTATSTEATIALKLSANPATACFTVQPSPFKIFTSMLSMLVKEGEGVKAKMGDRVFVNYSTYLTDCTLLETSRTGTEPFSFVLGDGKVIKGWDQAIVGMRVGGHRHVVIPADLAYGEKGLEPKVPANAVLLLEVELLDVKQGQN